MSERLAAIILAAGYSSRMAAFKPLLPLRETTVIERAIALFRDAGVSDIRVVVGYRAGDLLPLLERLHVRSVLNERFDAGMFSSVQAGVASLAEECDAFFLLPVDVPLVRPEAISLLVRSFGEAGKGIVYPAFRGERGHPPIIGQHYRERILAWSEPGGLRSLLDRHEGDSATVETADEGVVLDMDTMADYGRILRLASPARVPSARIPSVWACEAMLRARFGMESPVERHGQAVARLAMLIAKRLNERGAELETELLEAASLLHDLGKGEPHHADAGAEMLRQMGYAALGELVARHLDPPLSAEGPISEADVLALADGRFDGDRLVPLEARFHRRLEEYADNSDVLLKVLERLERARARQRRIEERMGVSVDALWTEAEL
ncbi:MAG: DVU_1551 family NTP transferase [Coriobacteriia bacterium]